jgi:hypothetical protein
MARLVQHKYVLRLKGIDITSTICSLITAKRYSYKILFFKYDHKIITHSLYCSLTLHH